MLKIEYCNVGGMLQLRFEGEKFRSLYWPYEERGFTLEQALSATACVMDALGEPVDEFVEVV